MCKPGGWGGGAAAVGGPAPARGDGREETEGKASSTKQLVPEGLSASLQWDYVIWQMALCTLSDKGQFINSLFFQ